MNRGTILIFAAMLAFVLPLFSQEAAPQDSAAPQETAAPQEAAPLEQAQPAQPTTSASMDSAMRLYRQRRYSAAVAEFEQIVAADPKNAAAHYFMGYAHYAMRHYDEAVKHFGEAFAADPAFDPRPYFRR